MKLYSQITPYVHNNVLCHHRLDTDLSLLQEFTHSCLHSHISHSCPCGGCFCDYNVQWATALLKSEVGSKWPLKYTFYENQRI